MHAERPTDAVALSSIALRNERVCPRRSVRGWLFDPDQVIRVIRALDRASRSCRSAGSPGR